MKKYVIYSLVATAIIVGGLTLVAWRRRAAIIAASFLNEMEIGENGGFASAAFQQMMQDVGWRGGEAWCMYFVKAVYLQAFPKKADQIARVLTGSTQTSWKNAINSPDVFKVIMDGRPQVGDIIIWQSVNNASTGHAGIVLKTRSDNQDKTVEGNSGMGGTREGEGVTVGERLLVPGTTAGSLKLLGFLRLKV